MQMIRGKAFIENTEGVGYDCLCDPEENWNGWAVPYFEKHVLKQVLADGEAQVIGMGTDTIFYKWNDEEMPNDLDAMRRACFVQDLGWNLSGWCFHFKPSTQAPDPAA